MIKFVNAKINLGLNIVKKRPDGYHELNTVFYPVGLYNGTPQNPEPFCDILEITVASEDRFNFTGNPIDCSLQNNLVYRAVKLFKETCGQHKLTGPGFSVWLDKHIPDGAGIGGGSADASFTLLGLNELLGQPFTKNELIDMAVKLGADCPFFIENTPVIAGGIGEIMTPIHLDLSGFWALIIKPRVYVSTKEAFAGITPKEPELRIEDIVRKPVDEWEKCGLKNDFEDSIFRVHPALAEIKNEIYRQGALYAAMSGSGSSIYGIFGSSDEGKAAQSRFAGLETFLCKL